MVLITANRKTHRVKGLAFHPQRPWLLTSLHNGSIQLWDYRMNTLIASFSDEHEGPVRAIDFHDSKPLFVSGGDDFKVKVWNYKQKRCEYTLQGHLDYVRTVEFHKIQPWIVSASDDQTIRIWNWQSRQCIAVLTGHHHYVMCAAFHHTEDLVVSCSLDQSIRVWDISALKQSSSAVHDDFMKMTQLNQDLFGNNEVMVKFIMEGHDRGVNWVSFHPTQNVIVSAADDRTIKLWSFTDERAWEVETIQGHSNNVSCVIFHPNKEIIISASEDRTLRFWDSNRLNLIDVHREAEDRFWILSAHPTQNLIAAGHDNGFMIFKLYRERPPYTTTSTASGATTENDTLFYIKDKYLKKYDFASGSEVTLGSIDKGKRPYGLEYLKQEGYFLVTEKARRTREKGSWDLYRVNETSSGTGECQKIQSGSGASAVFMGLRKFAILNGNGQLELGSLKNSKRTVASIPDTIGQVTDIFAAGSGRLLLKTEDKVYLYDREKRDVIASIQAYGVKFAIWSEDKTRVALIGRHHIVIANNELKLQCTLQESVRIKSGAFDAQGVFIFTTLNHMKYCLPNSDSGTIKTLEQPIYIVKVLQNAVYYLDRECNARKMFIDTTECRFKLALLQGQTAQIKKIIGTSKILGRSIIAYLQKKGFPAIAMKFVEDDTTKFNLALECGNIETARKAALKLDDEQCWKKLGVEALRQGDHQTVERCYQRTHDFEKLSFLYLITGNVHQLKNLLNKAQKRDNNMEVFHNALFLGDVAARIRVLLKAGQQKLAYVTARVHGLNSLADEIKQFLPEDFEMPQLKHQPQLMLPPTPILRGENWPLLHTQGNVFEESGDEEEINEEELEGGAWDQLQIPGMEESSGEGGEEDVSKKPATTVPNTDEGLLEEEAGGWENLEEIGDITDLDLARTSTEEFSAPTEGRELRELWVDNSQHPADHIAAGSFGTAMHVLNRALAITNFAPLKKRFLSLHSASRAFMPLTTNLPCIPVDLQRNMTQDNDANKHSSLPALASFDLESIQESLRENTLKKVTVGKFKEAHDELLSIIHDLLFVVIQNKKDDRTYREIVEECSQYLVATKLELTRKELGESDPKRAVELIAYFTRCKLNSVHIKLGLLAATVVAFKSQNFLSAATFGRRLLKSSPTQSMTRQATYILQMSEKTPKNKHDLNYDDRNPFVICGRTLTPIYAGSDSIQCSYCNSHFLPKFEGETCDVCQIATIGGKSSETLFNFISQFKR
mmetsp:Transcript_8349/g.30852  ORF Transcript_8349/g.30852 Transcript_8349/m.30852 type:complete len:1234 (-) Transcript_8349:112-3813(-)|eukprot:CAMPEP_0117443804 /NCGR_PEP_ID=MMETSP0759-20121206/4897_1 /TAXON_ID=63605 /ORGANISM="Percolomonas cosmopolitus, Strain WS" /LENGTH=1233 /DNA_ID=CAMNT_0005235817 /DNA_START=255 /DNA_END=3956 /DNA_ORIENTATION=+